MASRLESLPPELLIRLVEYFSRPSDLRALCLTSKALQVPATTQLYHCVTGVDAVHGWTRSDLNTTVLAETNPGLAQIRKLHFDTVAPAEQPDVGILAQVLKALPGSSLRGFDCSPCMVDEDTMITLMMRQHKLVTLGLGPLTFNPIPFVQAGLLDVSAFAKLEELDIPQVIGSQHDLELYQLIIEKATLRRLSIRTTTIDSDNAFNLDDEKDCDGLISKVLFKHIRDPEPDTRMQLRVLSLEDMDLKWSDRTFSHYFDWSVLEELQIWQCHDAEKLIKRLTQHFNEHDAQLKRFDYLSCTGESIDSSVLEAFLGSVEGLTHLSLIGIDNFSLLNLDVLAKHSGTLKWLVVHPEGIGNIGCIEMGIDLRFFSVVAKCQKLRQVALPLPKIDLPRTPDDFALSQTYKKALTTLLDLPELKSLRVYNFPLPKDKFIDCHVHDRDTDIINMRMYMQDLDDFAASCLTPLFARSKAAVPGPILCFHALGNCFVSDGNLEIEVTGPEVYVLSRYLDPFGQTHLTMRNTPLSAVRYMEPESEILG